MKQAWKEFLQHRGAEFDAREQVMHFGNPVRERKVVHAGLILADLSHLGLIRAYGEDTRTFLQGQLTNDTRQVSEEQAQLSGYCSPKGRLLASFLIFARGEELFLQLPAVLQAATQKRLNMYVLRSRVKLEDVSEQWIRIGFSGPGSHQHLLDQLGAAPSEPYATLQAQDCAVIRLPGEAVRFEIIGPLERMQKLWTALDVHAAPVGKEGWDLAEIHAGIPTVEEATVDAFVPQMVNLQQLNGVSFKKGCYTGQEIVARMQYLGKLKRRMYLAHVEAEQPPLPGDELFSSQSSSGQGTGKVVRAAAAPDGGYDLLAVIEISSVEAGDVRLRDEKGEPLQFLDLPYSLDESA